MILNSIYTIGEIDSIASDITTELATNREKIENTHKKIHEISSMTDSARRLIHSMTSWITK